MKKVFALFCVFMMSTHFSFATALQVETSQKESASEPISVLAIAKAITAVVGGSLDVYKTIPDAEYYMLYKAKDGKVAYVKADSATELINMAVVALDNRDEEAVYVILSSKYPSIKGLCIEWGRKYYKHDIDKLLQCL